MPAVSFRDFGAITGVTDLTKASILPYSKVGRDRDGTQTFIFECDSTNPFTGVVWIQGSMTPQENGLIPSWADVASLTFDNEGGSFFVEIDMELATVRVICKAGDYTGGKIKSIKTMR